MTIVVKFQLFPPRPGQVYARVAKAKRRPHEVFSLGFFRTLVIKLSRTLEASDLAPLGIRFKMGAVRIGCVKWPLVSVDWLSVACVD